ncbi:MAG: Tyrosine recombinase XerD, partial [Thermoleophilia bacterium]|nr:Tyrosine recombinase XerD [Thermoleophilia bacterium]
MRQPPEVLSAMEAEAILAQPNRSAITGLRNRCALEAMYRAGLRVSEVIQLRPRDVRWANSRLEVRDSKRGKGRNIPIRPATLELLERWRDSRPESDWFFSTCCERGGIATGAPIGSQLTAQYMQTVVARYARQAGVERRVTPHTFRHTYATSLLASGFTIREVQSLLGHSHVNTTMVYLHVNDDVVAA